MRIGQILIEADLVSAKQLSTGLEYGSAKHIALGRVLKLLKIMVEDDIERALQTQKLIRMGLSPVVAMAALKKAVAEKTTLESALQGRYQEYLNGAVAPPAGEAKPKFVDVDYSASPEKLIEKGDRLLLEDKCSEAEANYIQARIVQEKLLGKNHINLAAVLIRLGNAYMATERFKEAEECYEEVLILRIRAFPSDDPQIAQAHENLADLHVAWGNEAEAMESFQQALDILEKKLPAQLGIYASILRKIAAAVKAPTNEPKKQPIGELLKSSGLLNDEQLQQSLKLSKQTKEPLGTILRKNNIVSERDLQSALKSQMYVRQGVISESMACDLVARASRRGISLERLLHEANVLASDEERFDAYREIAICLDQLVAAESDKNLADHEIAPIAHKVATLYEQVGDKPQAEVYYSRALKIWGSNLRGDLSAARTCVSLAKLQQVQKKQAEVIPLLMKALEHRQSALGPNHEETIETLEDIAEAELEQQNPYGAINFLRGAMASRENLGHVDGRLLRCVVLSADCQRQLGNLSESEALYTQAINLAQAGFGSASPALAAVAEKLGDLYKEMQESKKSSLQYTYALRILKVAGKADTAAGQRLQDKVSAAV